MQLLVWFFPTVYSWLHQRFFSGPEGAKVEVLWLASELPSPGAVLFGLTSPLHTFRLGPLTAFQFSLTLVCPRRVPQFGKDLLGRDRNLVKAMSVMGFLSVRDVFCTWPMATS